MTNDLRQDNFFTGRSDELYNLVRNLQLGKHNLLVGDKGVGKTRLMQEAKKVLQKRVNHIDFSDSSISRLHNQIGMRINPNQYKILYIERSSPLSDCLNEISEKLFNAGDLLLPDSDTTPFARGQGVGGNGGEGTTGGSWNDAKKTLSKLNNNQKQNIIFESLANSNPKYLIFFDNLDRVTPTHQAFLEMLLNVTTVCAATVIIRDDIHLKKIWASFTKIEIQKLSKDSTERMVEYYFAKYPIKAINRELLKKQVIKSSGGIPFHIKNLIWQASCQKYMSDSDTRDLTERDENKKLNLGPVYVFILIFTTILKIASIGVSSREFYIYFSAIGFIGYVIFRVFRNFFIFKPQKQFANYKTV